MSEEESESGWATAPLGTFIERIEAGTNFKCDERTPQDGEVGVVKVSAVTWGEYDESESKTCKDVERVDSALLVRPGDFLFSRANTIELVGACVIARRVTKQVMLSDKILRFRLRGIEPEWVLHFLRSPAGRAAIETLATGNQESMRNIGQERIRSIPLPVAPAGQRARIVSAIEQHLSDIDSGVAAVARALANLKQYRASVLKAACEGRLVPTEAELARKEKRDYEPADVLLRRILKERRARWEADQNAKMRAKGQPPRDDRWKDSYEEPGPPDTSGLGALPTGWRWVALGLLGEDRLSAVQTGPFGAQLHNTEFVNSGVPVIAVGNLTGIGFTDEGLYFVTPEKAQQLSRYDVSAGDVLFARSGATLGKVAVAPGHVHNWRMTGHILRARLNRAAIDPHLLVYALKGAPAVIEQVNGSIRGVTRPGFNTALLENIIIPLPPLAEQHRIVAEVDRLLSTADETEQTLRAQLARAARLRQAVLKRAFEGKLVPQDPNDEPASALLARLRAQEPAEPKRAARSRPRRSARASEP